MPRSDFVLPSVSTVFAVVALVLVVWVLLRPTPGSTDLARIGCGYIRDVGEFHGQPVTECRFLGSTPMGDDRAQASFGIVQNGTRYTLSLRYMRAVWQVVDAKAR